MMHRKPFDDTIRRDPFAEQWRMMNGQPTLASQEVVSGNKAAPAVVTEDKADQYSSARIKASGPVRRND